MLMQAATRKKLMYPAGSPRDGEGGLTGTQVERDKENQMETLWMVTPSFTPSITGFFFSLSKNKFTSLYFLGGVVTAGGNDGGLIRGGCLKSDCGFYQSWI